MSTGWFLSCCQVRICITTTCNINVLDFTNLSLCYLAFACVYIVYQLIILSINLLIDNWLSRKSCIWLAICIKARYAKKDIINSPWAKLEPVQNLRQFDICHDNILPAAGAAHRQCNWRNILVPNVLNTSINSTEGLPSLLLFFFFCRRVDNAP